MSEAETDKQRCGVEVEFSGLDAHEAARVIADAIGGTVEETGRHTAVVHGTSIGDIKVGLDTRYAEPAKDPGLIDNVLDALQLRDNAAELLKDVLPVPVEMVTPPLTRPQFADLDRAITALREAGGEDTRDGALYAYGMHLNPELRGGAARAIRIAATYAFAERYLRHRTPPDNMRRVTPFVDPYGDGYVLALARGFRGEPPDLAQFIDLYAYHNPDRNRGLDMWPLLGHLDPDLAEEEHGGPIKNARPTFHYRLPDSLVGVEGWSPRADLDCWEAIERAADDPASFERLRATAEDFECSRISRQDYYEAVADVIG
ncbi:MAG TPA: amidoligase family protein [Paracoccaceae bacterium]|nr:amidoligase family protein [Paracoccaceae bacterium]